MIKRNLARTKTACKEWNCLTDHIVAKLKTFRQNQICLFMTTRGVLAQNQFLLRNARVEAMRNSN